ncbi:hypothetical protein [Microlunatus speluncae]|uniref:hypothetical protein n=1 Tax=Microlunatus speluncae TaxID=2594267 RepID=UPI0012666F50|nr:hypothetical protein [Microlunatus speluncae]
MSQLRVDTIGIARSLVPATAALLAAVLGVLCYHIGSDRLDFAAHYVAGLGGTMLLLSILAIRPTSLPRGWAVLGLTMLACVLGIGCETLFFVDGGFDLVDVSNQSLGAVTAALIFIVWPVRGVPPTTLWIILAVLLLGGGAKLVGYF